MTDDTPLPPPVVAPVPVEMARLHAACFTHPRPWSAEEIAALIADPAVLVEQDAAGFALARAVADEGEVLTIAVAPDQRRQGAGGRMLAALLAGLQARGVRQVFLEVAADNAAARALYARAGFGQVGLRRGYYATAHGRVDALVLRRDL